MRDIEFIRNWMSLQLDRTLLPAISFAVRQGNDTHSFCVGGSDGVIQLSDRSLFDVASQTKAAVVQALLVLQQEGQLELSVPVSSWFSGHDLKDVTILDLLTHSAGLPRDTVSPVRGGSPRLIVDRTLASEALFKKPRYSNVGFIMLGLILESVTGKNLPHALQELVLGPLEMGDTCWQTDIEQRNAALPHGALESGEFSRTDVNALFAPGATGLWSTPSDMCRLFAEFFGAQPGILSGESRRLATETKWKTSTTELALGLEVYRFAGHRWFGHTGGAPGFLSGTFGCEERNLVFSVAMNARDSAALEGCIKSVALWLSRGGLGGEQLDIEGRYESQLGYVELATLGSELMMFDPAQWDLFRRCMTLSRQDEDTLVVEGNDFNNAGSRFVVRRDDNGDVVGLQRGPFEFWRT